MSQTNSIPPYFKASSEELQNSFGITRMEGEDSWNQIIGGLILQGGICTGTSVSFSIPFPKKLLGIFGTLVIPSYTLEGFIPAGDDTSRTFYWFAIGF